MTLAGTISVTGAFEATGSIAIGGLSDAGASVSFGGVVTITSSFDNEGTLEAYNENATVAAAAFYNGGSLIASGATLQIGSGTGSLLNFSDGTLDGGFYEAIPGNGVSTGTILLTGGGAITTDAASVVIGSVIGGSGDLRTRSTNNAATYSLSQTLQTIAPSGSLVLNTSTFDDPNPISVFGLLQSQNAFLSTPGLTIQPSGTLVGSGTLNAAILNNGSIFVEQFLQVYGLDPTASLGLLFDSQQISGSGTIELASAGFYVIHGTEIKKPTTLDVAGTTNSIRFDDDAGVLIIENRPASVGPITGFVSGVDPVGGGYSPVTNTDVIDLKGVNKAALTSVTYSGTSSGGTLDLQDASGTISLNFVGNYQLSNFILTSLPGALSTSPPTLQITTNSTTACFVSGTRLATRDGDVAVEDLSIDAWLRCGLTNAFRAVRWIGRRRLACDRHPRPFEVWPVRIRASAFAAGKPRRDLLLSPDHAVFVDGVLIPIKHLINGATIVQEPRDEVVYWHVELHTHAVIIADGLFAESYLDTGNRGAFENAAVPELHPSFTRTAEAAWAGDACAELVEDGPRLEEVRAQLADRAEMLGRPVRRIPEIVLAQTGVVRSVVPGGAAAVRLLSDAGRSGEDRRRLGALVTSIHIDGVPLPLDDSRLQQGFHEPETHGTRLVRWTNGAATLAFGASPQARRIDVEVAALVGGRGCAHA